MTTTEVENFPPGFRAGITGPELMDEMREQALRFGADLRMEDVESVDLEGPVKKVVTGDGETHLARSVILAMGAAARYLGVPVNKSCSAAASAPAPPVTASSSRSRTSPSSAVATPPWRRRRS